MIQVPCASTVDVFSQVLNASSFGGPQQEKTANRESVHGRAATRTEEVNMSGKVAGITHT